MAKNYKHEMPFNGGWWNLTGKLSFNISNDYLFRALLQQDELTLKGILASFIGIDSSDINDVEITNPIIIGDDIDDKEFHLDVRAVVDHDVEIDFEMQMYLHRGWIERSVLYVCREFDNLNHGDEYSDVRGVWQISFCSFELKKNDRLCTTYMLVNTEDLSDLYTDKLKITNVNLNNVDKATENEKSCGIEKWARLFKAETWEDLRMIAHDDKRMDQAISSIWQLTEDRKVREQMQRRAENERLWADMEESIKEKDTQIKEQKMLLDRQSREIDELKRKLSESMKNS